MIAQSAKRQTLALKILKHRAFHVGALANVQNIEQRRHRHLMQAVVSCAGEKHQAVKEIFQPQIGPDTFVEGIFVKSHAGNKPV